MQKLKFVSKTAESDYFINFPLVFSRKALSLWRESKLMDTMLIGRKKEKQIQAEVQLDDLYEL